MVNLSILLGIVGPWQIAIIVVVAVLLFGGKKIPELMKGLGEGMKEFKKARNDFAKDDDVSDAKKEALKE